MLTGTVGCTDRPLIDSVWPLTEHEVGAVAVLHGCPLMDTVMPASESRLGMVSWNELTTSGGDPAGSLRRMVYCTWSPLEYVDLTTPSTVESTLSRPGWPGGVT